MRKFLIPPAMRKGHQYQYGPKDTLQNIKDIGNDSKNFIKKNYNLKEPLFMKDPKGRNMNNLWTGYGYGGKGRALATVGLLGGGSIYATRDVNTPMQSEQLDVESLPGTRADGLGYQAQVGETQGLHASGDLVFAMHKTRHYGQF